MRVTCYAEHTHTRYTQYDSRAHTHTRGRSHICKQAPSHTRVTHSHAHAPCTHVSHTLTHITHTRVSRTRTLTHAAHTRVSRSHAHSPHLHAAQQLGHQPDRLQVALGEQQLPLLRADFLLQPPLLLRLQLLCPPPAAPLLPVPCPLLAPAQLLLPAALALLLLQLLLLPAGSGSAGEVMGGGALGCGAERLGPVDYISQNALPGPNGKAWILHATCTPISDPCQFAYSEPHLHAQVTRASL